MDLVLIIVFLPNLWTTPKLKNTKETNIYCFSQQQYKFVNPFLLTPKYHG